MSNLVEEKHSETLPTANPFQYTPREEWKPRLPDVEGFSLMRHFPLPYVVVSNTGSPRCQGLECIRTLRKLQDIDIDENGLPDLKFNWLVGADGTIYEGLGWFTAVYWADPRHNPYIYNSITIGLIDDFNETPTKAALSSLVKVLREGMSRELLTRPFKTIKIWQKKLNMPDYFPS